MNTLRDKTILVLGGYGRLGTDLLPLLKAAGAKVLAPNREVADVADKKLWQVVGWHNPDIIINLAAYTDVAGAETAKGRDTAVRTNIYGSRMVCEIARYFDIKVVYISTDYVYPGEKGPHAVEEANPCCSYGITKYVGEWFCDPTKDLIIRTSFKTRGTWGPKAFREVFHPVTTNADWVDIIAEKIVDAIGDERVGIQNIGTEPKFLRDLAKAEYPKVKIVDVEDCDLPYTYPKDCSMLLD